MKSLSAAVSSRSVVYTLKTCHPNPTCSARCVNVSTKILVSEDRLKIIVHFAAKAALVLLRVRGIGKFLSTKVTATPMGCLMVKIRPAEVAVVPWILSASPANYRVKPGAKSISPYASNSGFPVSLTRMHAKCSLFSRIRIFHLRSSWARFLGFTFLLHIFSCHGWAGYPIWRLPSLFNDK